MKDRRMNDRLRIDDSVLAGKLTGNMIAYGYLTGSAMYFFSAPLIGQYLAVLLVGHYGSYNLLLAVLNLFFQLIMLVTMIAIMKDFVIESFRHFARGWKVELLWSFSVGFPVMFIINALLGGLVTLFVSSESANEAAITQQAQSNFAIIVITSVILAPVVEELFFRGVIFRSLSRYNVVLGMIVSSLVFGFIHIYQALFAGDLSQLYYLIQYGGMGLVLSWVYVTRRNIFSAVVVHLLNNAISMVLLWISFGLM